MGNDARVRYTKMMIRESFIQLNAVKPISQITVKEICELSDINRSTFYRNYIDVYDLKDQIENEFLQMACAHIRGRKIEDAEQVILYILETMKEHQHRYTNLHEFPSEKLLSGIIQEGFQADKQYLLQQSPHLTETEAQWYFEYVCGGAAFIFIDWAKNGMKEPPEKIARFIAKLVQQDFSMLKSC